MVNTEPITPPSYPPKTMAISKALLEDLEKRRAAARVGGGEDKLEARRKKGVMTARDRLAALFQPRNRTM